MSVYIETYALQNFLLDWLIAASSYRFLKVKRDVWRFLLVASVGTVLAVFLPLVRLPKAAEISVKLALGTVLSFALFCGKVRFIKGLFAFYASTFLFGGCVLFAGTLVYGSLSAAVGKPLPIYFSVTVISSLVLYYAGKGLSTAIHRTRDSAESVLDYRMTVGGREFCGKGFMDTGNLLYDSRTGLPVVVIGVGTLAKELSDEELKLLLSGKADKVFKGARRMTCRSVGGKSFMWLIAPQKFEVYSDEDEHILYDVMVGLSFSRITRGERYDAILHPALMEVH